MKKGGISEAAADLFPGYFALGMATGIISIAAHLLNMRGDAEFSILDALPGLRYRAPALKQIPVALIPSAQFPIPIPIQGAENEVI